MRVSMVRPSSVICFGFLFSLMAAAQPNSLRAADEESPAGALGVITNAESAGGVRILSIIPGTPAADSKLRPGDVILSVDGITVKTSADVSHVVEPHKPGFNLHLEVDRQGLIGSLWVIVGSKDDVERARKLHAAPQIASVARAERFELVDSEGRVLATIEPAGSTGGLAIYDRAGNLQWTSAGNPLGVATFGSSTGTAVRRYSYYGNVASTEQDEIAEPRRIEVMNLDHLDPEGPSSGRHPFYGRR
jgi:membrane-associated protease RseP (regulator of RpoE activity)